MVVYTENPKRHKKKNKLKSKLKKKNIKGKTDQLRNKTKNITIGTIDIRKSDDFITKVCSLNNNFSPSKTGWIKPKIKILLGPNRIWLSPSKWRSYKVTKAIDKIINKKTRKNSIKKKNIKT